jgi:poly(hydroxyalkanoate) granule-associated protein
MAIKKKKEDLIPGLKESAHNIWLAGLGAYSVAGEEGSRLFKQLVDKGSELDAANMERINHMAQSVRSLKGDAKDALAMVTTPIEAGLASAMQRLGVPSREEIVNLTQRVEELTRIVAKSKAADKPKAAEVPKRRARTARA